MISVQKLTSTLLLLAGLLVCMAATHRFLDGPVCKMKMKYTGDISNPNWISGSEVCEGTCPSGAGCLVKNDDDADNVFRGICRCPSNGGNEGCHAVVLYKRISPEHAWVFVSFTCAGGEYCGSQTPTCDWKDLGPVQNEPGVKWGACKCQ